MEEDKKDGFHHKVTCKLLPRRDVRVSCLHIKRKILKKRLDINFYNISVECYSFCVSEKLVLLRTY